MNLRWLTPIVLTVWPLGCLSQDRPNVVLVMADDQGWGDMAYQGHPVVKTPHFDAAAREAVRFDRFYAAAPVCSPTRASVLTGRHPNRMGVFRWGYPIRPQETTLAELLRDSGYATGHFGKWHLGSVRNLSPANPGRNGFDEWFSAPNFFDNDPILSRNGRAVATRGESSGVTVDAALDWIEAQSQTLQPFLAVVWFGSPHRPHVATAEDRKAYRDQPEERQHFYGEITAMDRAFGKLRLRLEKLGIRRNTIVWYCSDNGALPDVGSTGGRRGHKGQIYEGGLLVPALLEWPARLRVPQSIKVPCTTSDILPTILELAGVPWPKRPVLDGISLAPLLVGQMPDRPRPIGFWDYPVRGIRTPSAEWMQELLEAQQQGMDLAPHASSRNAGKLPKSRYSTTNFPGHSAWLDGNWKLHRIAERGKSVRWELYDLASDPSESHDLADVQTRRRDTMRRELEAWMRSVVDSLNGDDYRRHDPSSKPR